MAKKSKNPISTIDISRKKVKEFDIDINIRVVNKTGRIMFGKNQVLRELRSSTFKMIIIANNCPKELENQLLYNNSLLKENKIFIHRYISSSWDLGLACAKPYMISIIGIIDYGDSQLSTLIPK